MKSLVKYIFRKIACIVALGFIAVISFNAVDVTYACYDVNPDVTIIIDKSGNVNQEGSIFNELFYPGKSESGIIRIKNETPRNIDINNLGLGVDLTKYTTDYNKDYVYNSFLNNMRLTIQRGKLSYFMYNVIDNKPVLNLLYKENDNNYMGIDLRSNRFTVSKGDFVDLKYTMTMDITAEEELEDLKVNLEFRLNGGSICY